MQGMGQYLLVAGAVGFLILLKLFALRRKFDKQIDGYMNP
jgi:hypothetical protein